MTQNINMYFCLLTLIIVVCILTYTAIFKLSGTFYHMNNSPLINSASFESTQKSGPPQVNLQFDNAAQDGQIKTATHNAFGSSNPDILLFNRVHKSGGVNFVRLIQSLEKRNKFKHFTCDTCPSDYKRLPTYKEQLDWVSYFDYPEFVPMSYERHVYFLDFEQFGKINPTWFSLAREPVAKFQSKFYFSRNQPAGLMYDKIIENGHVWMYNTSKDEWRAKDISDCVINSDPECDLRQGVIHDDLYIDLAIPYFCGHNFNCSMLGSRWAYDQAVMNVERWYPVVGILEDLDATIKVLEAKLPQFFNGFSALYNAELKDFHFNKGKSYKPLSPKARSIVKSNLTMEVKFYKYLKARLRKQIKHLERL